MDISGAPKKIPPTLSSSTSNGLDSSLMFSVQNEKSEVVNDDKNKQELVVMASIKSVEIEQEDKDGNLIKRNPIELVVVLDRSGSMAGSKLELCISTMQFLVDELSSKDSIALVVFDTNVRVVFPLTKMDSVGKQMALDSLATVKAGSSTNLSGGLFKGIELLVEESKKDVKLSIPPTRSIMLLTDGMANAGVTDLQQLIKISKTMMNDIEGGASTSIHCFGYGADADAPFCTAISEACHGMFYAVNEIDQVSTAFGNCIGGLLAVSAQNIKLVFTPASPSIEIKEVMTKFEQTKDPSTGSITVSIPDMYSEECRDVLYRIALGTLPKDSASEIMQVGKFTITFMDVKYEKLNKIEENCYILRPKVVSVEGSKPNEGVTKQLMRIEGAKALAEAQKLADAGNLLQAQQRVELTRGMLASMGTTEDGNDMLSSMMHDLSESSKMMSSEKEYQARGKSKMASYEISHNFQRSNAVSQSDAFGNAYQTKSRLATQQRAFEATSKTSKPSNPSGFSGFTFSGLNSTVPPISIAAPTTNATTTSTSAAAANPSAKPSTSSSPSENSLFRRFSNSFRSTSQSNPPAKKN